MKAARRVRFRPDWASRRRRLPGCRAGDLAGAGACILLLALAGIVWSLADRYRETFFIKRAAAPLKYDDNVIAFLRHGHTLSIALVAMVVVAVALRVAFAWWSGRRHRRGRAEPRGE